MSLLAILLHIQLWLIFDSFIDSHPLISLALFLWLFRYALRWFFGINKIRRAQSQYTELLEQHNDLLQRQTEMMEQHKSVLGKLGEKYL
ncbi:hypothetical protein IDJ77_06625 [Mucilaginibacter sp. ZT4R22]|uniref:Uncharacterized protein n=1 Tax=Mucilaginibacter pankratovii TaxID=2772110 RepID=A0ABR7WMC3_9SPHI|nr:hypothetical protein [Mucilaginibacter pankratovii]MBD1363478.1 hypothetical protein [Mucilaginibacter pankratovii]